MDRLIVRVQCECLLRSGGERVSGITLPPACLIGTDSRVLSVWSGQDHSHHTLLLVGHFNTNQAMLSRRTHTALYISDPTDYIALQLLYSRASLSAHATLPPKAYHSFILPLSLRAPLLSLSLQN